MKKFISSLLALCMIFSMTPSAFATSSLATASNTSIQEIDGGYLYTSTTNDRKTAILTNTETHLIDISISYPSSPNTVYQWTIEDYPASTFSTADSFWNGIIDYAESHMDSADIVTFTDVAYDDPVEIQQTRSSAGADLMEELESLVGSSEYSARQIFSCTYNGQVHRIFELMDFRIYTDGFKRWSTAISVASFIVSVLGLPQTTTLVKAICGAFGVALSAASVIPAGRVDKYICRAVTERYVTINGSNFQYNWTDRYIEYRGYENADNNSYERAYLDTGSRVETYVPSEAYFFSYADQVEDAYSKFLDVGQQN